MKRPSWPVLAGCAAFVILAVGVFPWGRLNTGEGISGEALDQRQRTLSSQLDGFRGDNGLFVNSFGAVNQPGLYQSAYGLSALRASGDPVQVRIPGPEIRQKLSTSIEQDPLWGRYYFALVEQATGKRLHTVDDVRALRNMLTADGYFQDPAPASPRDPALPLKLSQTTAALEALEQFGSPVTPNEAGRIARWLRRLPASPQPQMVVEYNLARAFRLVGSPPPEQSAARVRAWQPSDRARSAEERSAQLTDTSAYVLAAELTDVDLSSQRAELEETLRPGDGDLADPQMAWIVTRALRALSSNAASSVSASTRRHLLPNGLMSRAQSHLGTLGASYQVERLRMAEGLPTRDDRLRQGLERARGQLSRSAPLDRAMWLVTYQLAGGTVAEQDGKDIRQAVKSAFPRRVSLANVQEWSYYVDVLQLMDEPVPDFSVARWTARTPEEQSARNILLFNLSRTGRMHLLAGRPTGTELIAEAVEQLKGGTVTGASLAVDAAGSVGWVTDETTSRQLRKQLAGRTGCAEGSLLVRDTNDADECSVAATLAAARLSNLLEVPGGPDPSQPESEDHV
ncbi:hypothetical protein PV371_21700 [Streptomyces sp. TX20-6-3]|uniref:hypothetical protein n=1 Tax=Streptomyces sp. TX20-6-3 TaxID=3028705 RepID=UPI0029BB3F6C|nr:hypothetical protein [Streptomyces sp. TX20-6-3]MDX2562252.1 hypothetical protein [Streptomyces sp. TX20-6-3]